MPAFTESSTLSGATAIPDSPLLHLSLLEFTSVGIMRFCSFVCDGGVSVLQFRSVHTSVSRM